MPEDRQKIGNIALAAPSATQRAHPRYQFTATAEALDAQHPLMRKGTLSEEEGRTMLLRLVHHDFRP
jgi:hypothetical protein